MIRWIPAVPGDDPFRNVHPPEPELRTDDLGAGWEEASQALADLQADLSRTVPDAPKLILEWYERPEGGRHVYLGKAVNWYSYSVGVDLSPNYIEALFELAYQLREAIQDSLLGDRSDWPLCPDDGWTLTVSVTADQTCLWFCDHGGHAVAEVGQLYVVGDA